eukprot:15627325-Heterocapsa_arctica.AAC.1
MYVDTWNIHADCGTMHTDTGFNEPSVSSFTLYTVGGVYMHTAADLRPCQARAICAHANKYLA